MPDEALVRGDERLLRRVTGNLIDNANKHGVALRARRRPRTRGRCLATRGDAEWTALELTLPLVDWSGAHPMLEVPSPS